MDTRANQAQQRPRAPKRSSDLEPEFVSIEDAAAVLGIGKTLFREEIFDKGLIEPVYIGRRLLFAVDDVRELAKQLRAVGDIRSLAQRLREKAG